MIKTIELELVFSNKVFYFSLLQFFNLLLDSDYIFSDAYTFTVTSKPTYVKQNHFHKLNTCNFLLILKKLEIVSWKCF